MFNRLIYVALTCTLLTARSPSQDDVVLEVRPDVHYVAANSLVGIWERIVELCERLGKNGADLGFEFRDDPTVLGEIAPGLRRELGRHRIYLAGWMVKHTSTGKIKRAYLLTAQAGNSTVVWFRERKGHPMGDAESFNVSLIRANDRRKDLLFIGGDFNNQSFEAFSRQKVPVANLSAQAAVAEMLQLVQDGKLKSFVHKYCAPEILSQMLDEGRGVDDGVKRLRRKSDRLTKSLTAASKQDPTMSKDGDTASWDFQEAAKDITLVRIEGRWYLTDR